jgi:hypothetical protein
MNSVQSYNTIDLLDSSCDAIHTIFHLAFKLIRPTRRKYRLSVNTIVILNACYLFHKYKGSIFTINQIYLFVGYYNVNRINYYIPLLISKGYIIQSDIIKDIKYYRITLAGIEVINYFHATYQAQLSKFLQSHKIDL